MDERELLVQEYNNLWNEKLTHKQSLRKFHHYLTYVTAVGSLALAVHGLSVDAIIKAGTDPKVTESVLYLFFALFPLVVAVTATFPINDTFHIYVIGNQIGALEKKINILAGKEELLTWEHKVCPVVYGGKKVRVGEKDVKLRNLIVVGDMALLIPAILGLCVVFGNISWNHINATKSVAAGNCYIALFGYMFLIDAYLLVKLGSYARADGPLGKVIGEQEG